MTVSFSADEIDTLLTCIQYSKRQVGDAQGTPDTVRQETLAKLDNLAKKLRDARSPRS
jgi:hypothetical protein